MKQFIQGALLAFILSVSFSCKKDFHGLDVKNHNSPDINDVLADPSQYPNILQSVYNKWWYYSTSMEVGDYKNGNMAHMAFNADIYTAGAGNWGLRDWTYQTNIPKPPINNSDPSTGFNRDIWYNAYSMLHTARNIALMINQNGKKLISAGEDKTPLLLANAYMQTGMVLGDIGLLFDKGFIITENTVTDTITGSDLVPYTTIIDSALFYLDKSISICESNAGKDNFEGLLPNNFISTTDKLAQFANFYAARLLAYKARTSDENKSADWTRILNYAKKGITENMKVTLPDPLWYVGTSLVLMSDRFGNNWYRVNQRIINMMATPGDPGAVYPIPQSANDKLPKATSPDFRLGTDFVYTPDITTVSGGLTYPFPYNSFWQLNRFIDAAGPDPSGDFYIFLAEERDLLEAEALIRTNGDKNAAAALINKTRVNRGHLAALTASSSNDEMLKAIFYERFVEISWTYPPAGFFDRRRTEFSEYQLAPHSWTQLPVPFEELNIFNLPSYTFGG